ncbi:hypothetical protein [Hoeflea ulvae]|uniref:Cytochrome c domain-containing protein n=1 Tax=Hoeflea ulvae TaxID=2983764 RepID=A0ABT3YIR0_9HYPH|nr:hypothetical protein [Hoeflea ulvae]MCY0095786.1 hypothetical protein [Hoeflea ulvae]
MTRNCSVAWTILTAGLGLAIASTAAIAQDTRPAYEPISALYRYFQENKELDAAVQAGDRAFVRNHSWNLWAGMMQPLTKDENSWPIWFSWQTSHQAFAQENGAPGPKSRPARRIPSQAGHSRLPVSDGAGDEVNTPQPQYQVPTYVIRTYPDGVTKGTGGSYSVNDGTYFVNNGDILIATESLSQEGYDAIRSEKLYLKKTLENALKDNENIELPRKYVSTKHMYWPAKADGLTPLPVWNENFPDFYAGYAGYELWNSVVAIDPSNTRDGEQVEVTYLFGVKTNEGATIPPQTKTATVASIDRFYHHRVTDKDWELFSDADKAILNAASIWLYDEPFGVGDYLVTVAAHVNTKEIESWTLQSVWWSQTPDKGPYAANRPELPEAVGPWKHYLMTDAYAFAPDAQGNLEKAVNPYIEGVTHPIATSCRNCHVRAGTGNTGYQTPQCFGLLTSLTPDSECFKGASLTDYIWIIPDRAH